MSVVCYPSPGKRKGGRLCRFFAEGAGGSVAPEGHPRLIGGHPAFFYGWTAHSIPLIRQCITEGRDWYYADNAYYFGRAKYFRVTKNSLMHNGSGPPRNSISALARFDIQIKPWRREGRHILVATQSEAFYEMRMGRTRRQWTDSLMQRIALYSGRPVVVCDKPPATELRADQAHSPRFEALLRDCWAMVTHSSSAAVKAVVEGIPVFTDPEAMTAPLGNTNLSQIESPILARDRDQWLANLLANQWTRQEFADGTCWRGLKKQHGLPVVNLARMYAAPKEISA